MNAMAQSMSTNSARPARGMGKCPPTEASTFKTKVKPTTSSGMPIAGLMMNTEVQTSSATTKTSTWLRTG